jgi:hypothetical protein
MKYASITIIFISIFLPKLSFAHCPLCTAGAGALAILAASLGVSSVIVGVLIGAFSVALGLWIAPLINKKFIPYQKQILTILIYLGTVVPIMPLIKDYGPLYINWIGNYGNLFHNTYTINLYLLGAFIGTLIMLASPYLSKLITKIRGEQIPYQGLGLTLGLLIIVSIVIQLLS